MAPIRKHGSKRRKMYFRGTSKRDSNVSPEQEEVNYRKTFTQYCSICMAQYDLEGGKYGIRRVGKCGICGAETVYLVGGMENNADKIIDAKIRYTRENYPQIPDNQYIDNNRKKFTIIELDPGFECEAGYIPNKNPMCKQVPL